MGFPDLTKLFQGLFWMLVAALPLALWKLVDIGVWLWQHVSIGVK